MRTSLAVTLLIAACGGTQPPPSAPADRGAAIAMHEARAPAPFAVDGDAAAAATSDAPVDGGAAPGATSAAPVDGGAAPAGAAPTTAQLATAAPRTAPVKVGTPGDRTRVYQLTVTVHGAGAVRGGVRSVPAGIDCVLADTARASTKTCRATFFVGETITLQFVPGGASRFAQFHDGTRVICDGQACTFELVGEANVAVYPISVPPPPGPARRP